LILMYPVNTYRSLIEMCAVLFLSYYRGMVQTTNHKD
jgi:hypothetical protein